MTTQIKKPIHGPEWHIQKDVIRYLASREWHVERMIGNAFQMGIPDLYAAHKKWGTRWIDVKQPKKYGFTRDQKRKWPIWESFGIGIWILTAANQEEYDKLFKAPNWRSYWKKSWGQVPTQADIDRMLDELVREGESA
jgi:hypothetical protein